MEQQYAVILIYLHSVSFFFEQQLLLTNLWCLTLNSNLNQLAILNVFCFSSTVSILELIITNAQSVTKFRHIRKSLLL